MTLIEKIANYESKIRNYIGIFPPHFISFIYSNSRKIFLKNLTKSKFSLVKLPTDLKVKLWDIEFNNSIFNAAGMFKDGIGYELCYKMGAGAFLAGTTTYNMRLGNKKKLILHPFMPYPYSKAASNWMGLPNKGHEAVANILKKIEKKKGCPVGISVSFDNDKYEQYGMYEGLKVYEKANVDFIELNESCPNVEHNSDEKKVGLVAQSLIDRLEFISKFFIKKCNRNIPIIVKFSNDTKIEVIPALIDILVDLKFSGINFGNTSVNYGEYINNIDEKDKKLFLYFTQTFGGGLSGEILKNTSLNLCAEAIKYIKNKNLQNEFHCIRTGGISSLDDIIISKNNGILLNEWFTGFFDNFAKNGFNVYKLLFK